MVNKRIKDGYTIISTIKNSWDHHKLKKHISKLTEEVNWLHYSNAQLSNSLRKSNAKIDFLIRENLKLRRAMDYLLYKMYHLENKNETN